MLATRKGGKIKGHGVQVRSFLGFRTKQTTQVRESYYTTLPGGAMIRRFALEVKEIPLTKSRKIPYSLERRPTRGFRVLHEPTPPGFRPRSFGLSSSSGTGLPGCPVRLSRLFSLRRGQRTTFCVGPRACEEEVKNSVCAGIEAIDTMQRGFE